MTKLAIKQRIHLTGIKPLGYTVLYDMPEQFMALHVPTTKVGNAIVRALRELAYKENAQ